jgi:hypothetical protein
MVQNLHCLFDFKNHHLRTIKLIIKHQTVVTVKSQFTIIKEQKTPNYAYNTLKTTIVKRNLQLNKLEARINFKESLMILLQQKVR